MAKDARKDIEEASAREHIVDDLARCCLCEMYKVVVLRRDVVRIHD